MKRAIFFDRDGTLNIDRGYVYKVEDFEFIPGTLEALPLLKDQFIYLVITNQSGIGRGFYTENEFLKLNKYMLEELQKNGTPFAKTYYCPHSPQDNCDCRKPKTALIKQAIQDFNLDIKQSFIIGDKISDIETGLNSGMGTILFKDPQSITNNPADFTTMDMATALAYIQKQISL
jgi:D-glycero-D-manno-heptose 1,7-bisphosphate phosphatase